MVDPIENLGVPHNAVFPVRDPTQLVSRAIPKNVCTTHQ